MESYNYKITLIGFVLLALLGGFLGLALGDSSPKGEAVKTKPTQHRKLATAPELAPDTHS